MRALPGAADLRLSSGRWLWSGYRPVSGPLGSQHGPHLLWLPQESPADELLPKSDE